MLQYDVIIIGAGPAGLFAGIHCGKRNLKTLILEKNNCAGKKLLLSGSGQCNFTHNGDIADFLVHYGDNGRFLKKALYAFSNLDLVEYLEKHGVRSMVDGNGKFFPTSLNSKDVLEALLSDVRSYKIEIRYADPVMDIVQQDPAFQIITNNDVFFCKNIIIATGGSSYPYTGSSGDGFLLAEKMGHSIVAIGPALVPVFVKDYPFSELAGISFPDSLLVLYRHGKKLRETRGDILFTHKNFSGPGILDFSRYVEAGDELRISFVNSGSEEFHDRFLMDLRLHGAKSIKNVLNLYGLPERFILKLCEMTGVAKEMKASHCDKLSRKLICQMLTEFVVIVEKTGDLSFAMATRGGVDLQQVSSASMESKLVRGLFFCGEVLNIDGDTGGYNIQAAFSTGFFAAHHIRDNL